LLSQNNLSTIRASTYGLLYFLFFFFFFIKLFFKTYIYHLIQISSLFIKINILDFFYSHKNHTMSFLQSHIRSTSSRNCCFAAEPLQISKSSFIQKYSPLKSSTPKPPNVFKKSANRSSSRNTQPHWLSHFPFFTCKPWVLCPEISYPNRKSLCCGSWVLDGGDVGLCIIGAGGWADLGLG
jgi:hypothetical protein